MAKKQPEWKAQLMKRAFDKRRYGIITMKNQREIFADIKSFKGTRKEYEKQNEASTRSHRDILNNYRKLANEKTGVDLAGASYRDIAAFRSKVGEAWGAMRENTAVMMKMYGNSDSINELIQGLVFKGMDAEQAGKKLDKIFLEFIHETGGETRTAEQLEEYAESKGLFE